MASSPVPIVTLSERQNHRRCYCGRRFNDLPASKAHRAPAALRALCATVDHVRPRSRGGKDSDKNTVAACLDCNNGKGDADAFAFFAHRQTYGFSSPNVWADYRRSLPQKPKSRSATRAQRKLLLSEAGYAADPAFLRSLGRKDKAAMRKGLLRRGLVRKDGTITADDRQRVEVWLRDERRKLGLTRFLWRCLCGLRLVTWRSLFGRP